MLLFRSVVVGLLAACCILLAQRPRCEVTVLSPRASSFPRVAFAPPQRTPQPTIIDVAPLVAAPEIPRLLRLGPGEHIDAVGDARVTSDLEAGAVLAHADLRPGHYIDVSIAGASGERRVLVLLH